MQKIKRTSFRILILLLSATVLSCSGGKRSSRDTGNPEWDAMDEILARIREPVFGEYQVSITAFGVISGQEALITGAIHQAILLCHQQGGGTVVIPEGSYRTGPVRLKSNVRLHLEKGAVLNFSTNPMDYLPPVFTHWEGIELYNYSPLIYANGAENIAITGQGTLNGGADPSNWWTWKGRPEYGHKKNMPSQLDSMSRPRLDSFNVQQVPAEERVFGPDTYLRPQFINMINSRNILIENITIINAPFWLIHPVLSQNITIRRVTMASHGPNNDGCDPESCKDVLIEDCFFDTGDDCIALKSGRNEDGRRINVPCENIIIRNCTMHDGHGGIVIGSEISGGCRNVFVENCTMDSPNLDRAVRIKTNTVRGGVVQDIFIRNLTIRTIKEAVLKIHCFYHEKNEGTGVHYPEISNIYLENITSNSSRYGVYLNGLEPSESIHDIYLVNCTFKGVKEGNIIKNVSNLNFINSFMNGVPLE